MARFVSSALNGPPAAKSEDASAPINNGNDRRAAVEVEPMTKTSLFEVPLSVTRRGVTRNNGIEQDAVLARCKMTQVADFVAEVI